MPMTMRAEETAVAFGKSRQAATHAAAEGRALACGTKPGRDATVARLGDDLMLVTCRTCRAQIGLDGRPEHARIEALLVLALTLGMRPGELRALLREHVDLERGVSHVWRGARRDGATQTPQ